MVMSNAVSTDDMNSLVVETMELVHSSVTPADAAGRVLTYKILKQLNPHSQLSLAVIGLAHLVNDELAAERTRKIKEEFNTRREVDTRQQEEEQRHRQEQSRRLQSDSDLQAEVRRLHELSGCERKGCKTAQDQARCLGGIHVPFLPPEQRESIANATRQEKEDRQAYWEKIRRIHREMHCRNRSCANSDASMANCVKRFVLWYPEDEQAARIANCREDNDKSEREDHGFWHGVLDTCKDIGYRQAVANLKSIMLIAADGTMKSLLDFSRDDVTKWKSESAVRAASWQSRNEWFTLASVTLGEARVNSIGELPPGKIRELAEHAERVWKKDKDADSED
jgi:hypothetical protein